MPATVLTLYIVLILILVYVWKRYSVIEYLTANGIRYYDFGDRRSARISVGLIGSVHGNEPVGHVALSELVRDAWFDKFASRGLFIRVIPRPNPWGLKNGMRYQPSMMHPDINRNFAGEGTDPTSREILRLIGDMDMIIDIHEGYDFHLLNPQSVGSTLSPSNSGDAIAIAKLAVSRLNQDIIDPFHKFIILFDQACVIPNTLACYRKGKQAQYILVEISGQNDIQPIDVRKKQAFVIIDVALNYLSSR